ncbi:hypothetical protein D3C72_445110 [compost metagenome]
MHPIILPDLGVPEIEVRTPTGQVDLHNFANFDGLQYGVSGALSLRWTLIEDDSSKLDDRPVKTAQLNFEGVTNLSISPPDPEIPRYEDASLEHFRLVEKGPDSLQMAFEFMGGSIIEVTARQVNLSVCHSFFETHENGTRGTVGIDTGRLADALHVFWQLPLETAYDVVFHLGDAADDWRRLLPMLEKANEFSDAKLGEEILSMLIHTPNHLMAAAHLMGHTPTDVWGLGIEVAPEASS